MRVSSDDSLCEHGDLQGSVALADQLFDALLHFPSPLLLGHGLWLAGCGDPHTAGIAAEPGAVEFHMDLERLL